MAFRNKILKNRMAGQDILFLQTAADTKGQLLEMETTYHPYSAEPPVHYHPCQDEDFTVLSGELTVRIQRKQIIMKRGDSLHIKKNTAHAMWNNSQHQAVVRWQVRPAMNTEQLLEIIYGLAADGKINKQGRLAMWQAILIAKKFFPVFRLAKPGYMVQRIIVALLSPLSLLLGYRPVYKKYID